MRPANRPYRRNVGERPLLPIHPISHGYALNEPPQRVSGLSEHDCGCASSVVFILLTGAIQGMNPSRLITSCILNAEARRMRNLKNAVAHGLSSSLMDSAKRVDHHFNSIEFAESILNRGPPFFGLDNFRFRSCIIDPYQGELTIRGNRSQSPDRRIARILIVVAVLVQ